MLPYIIAILCLFQVSIYAQESAQVTLSIRLYPIQTIEIAPADSQTIEISNEEITSNSYQAPSSTQPKTLTAFSTSKYTMQVDSINGGAFKEMRSLSAVPPRDSRSTNRIIDAERYDYEAHGDDLHVMYSMEAL